MFEAFYRGTDTPVAAIKGSGLGLSIVKEYVTLHRGRIEILEGPGAHFRIRFPRKQERSRGGRGMRTLASSCCSARCAARAAAPRSSARCPPRCAPHAARPPPHAPPRPTSWSPTSRACAAWTSAALAAEAARQRELARPSAGDLRSVKVALALVARRRRPRKARSSPWSSRSLKPRRRGRRRAGDGKLLASTGARTPPAQGERRGGRQPGCATSGAPPRRRSSAPTRCRSAPRSCSRSSTRSPSSRKASPNRQAQGR